MPFPCPDCGGALKVNHIRYVEINDDKMMHSVEKVDLSEGAVVLFAVRYRKCDDCGERFVACEVLVERARQGGDQTSDRARARRVWDTRYRDIETFVKSIGKIERKVRPGKDA